MFTPVPSKVRDEAVALKGHSLLLKDLNPYPRLNFALPWGVAKKHG